MEKLSELLEVGATPPIDILPILKWFPERFLGNWISRSHSVGRAMDRLYGGMVARVQQRRLVSGSRGSFLDGILDQYEKLGLSTNELNFLCGTLMEGGSDTSSSTILAFIHAMIAFPHVQETAQREIDAVVGEDRSPLWSDRAQLPYVAAVVKETMRWRPVAPLAFPHALSEAKHLPIAPATDDTSNGYTLPKGTTVFLNVWALHHDPTHFPSPDIFDPARFAAHLLSAAEYAVSADYEGRDHYGYGCGRRLCPGIHLAERNLFLAMAKLLWAFRFAGKGDGRGGVGTVDVDAGTGYSEGFLHCPKVFEAEVMPRSEGRRETILREFGEVEREVFAGYESG
ncbi:hypothetical protein MMC30_005628 [Trapelia coarctata]|nr:hypothetical protein [Trapelia coarctata]